MAGLKEEVVSLEETIARQKEEIQNLAAFTEMANGESARLSMQHDVNERRMGEVIGLMYNLLSALNATLEITKGNLDQLVTRINADRGGNLG